MPINKAHILRIRNELKAVGITTYGLSKMATKELPNILHEDEHIGGIVYGQVGGGNSAMLVATDRRIIFVDKRLMFTATDELTYDVVSGIKTTSSGPFTSIILHTRINEYVLRYVNSKCARIFTAYIEKKRLEKGSYDSASGTYSSEMTTPVFQESDNAESLAFLKSQELGVLSTLDRTGNVHGAVVYYVVDQNNQIYILTKSETGKGKNVYAHNQIALTIHEAGTLKTLQIQGIAEVETDQETKDSVMAQIIKPRNFKNEMHLPPVAKLKAGAFMVIRITPTLMKFRDYTKDE